MMESYSEMLFQVEAGIRLVVFLSLLFVLLLVERVRPKRVSELLRSTRWPANIGLLLIGALLVRVTLPVVAVAVSLFAQQQQFGLLNQWDWPLWVKWIIAILILDLAIYWQHRLFHKIPALWALHQVHHSDLELDVTSALRFHPFEIFLSMLIKMAVVMMFGLPPVAVLLFEIILNGTAMFNHANIALPTVVDRWLRYFIVTPDMHRIHHSVEREEMQRNFGFCLTWWDFLFRSYRAEPNSPQESMLLGLKSTRKASQLTLIKLLAWPFRTFRRS